MADATKQVQVERVVQAPPEWVYALVADLPRMGEWSPETDTVVWTGGTTAPSIGATFKGTNRNGKKKWSTKGRVVAADPGSRFAFEIQAGPLKVARWEYAFEPAAAGGCRVVETWTDQRGKIVTWGGKPASGVSDRATHNRTTMEQTLERLAVAAESAGTPGAGSGAG